LLVLLFAFGSVAAAVVPVLLALSAVAAGLGLLGPLSQLFPVEDSAKTVVLLIGMAVGVDYALFFVVRSRAERSPASRSRRPSSIASPGGRLSRPCCRPRCWRHLPTRPCHSASPSRATSRWRPRASRR